MTIEPYPLLLRPILKAKVWGGRRLESLGKRLDEGAMVGESWELADLDSTDPGGGGGEGAHTVIAQGPLAGKTVRDAMGLWGERLLGGIGTVGGGFPLLVKYLDAREHLSVQVHPSPAYAAAHSDAHLKTECWYVVSAEPGSVVFKGVKAGVTRERFESALRDGEGEGVVELLEATPAEVGQMHELPSGTVHALGAGVLVAEVQTPSDTTFRVYDWAREYGRGGRTLHVDQAMACIDFGPALESRRLKPDEQQTRLVDNEFFSVDEHRLSCESRALQDDGLVILMMIKGMGVVSSASATFEDVSLMTGNTALVPASAARGLAIGAGPDSRMLVVRAKSRR